jgi:hypothetical protein
MWNVSETGKMRTGFRWEDLRERDHLKDLGVDGRIISKWIFKNGMQRHGMDLSGLR